MEKMQKCQILLFDNFTERNKPIKWLTNYKLPKNNV